MPCLLVALLRLCCAISICALFSAPCSADGPGIPNVSRVAGEFLAGPLAESQGRTAVLVWHQGYLITTPESPGSAPGSDLSSRVWDLSDPRNPTSRVIAEMQQDTYIAAHGYYHEGSVIRGWNRDFTVQGAEVVPFDDPPGIPFFYPRNPSVELPWLGRGLMFQPFQTMMWWSYGSTNQPGALFKGDRELAIWNQISETGVIGHPFLVGNILYIASDQSETGIAAYEISPSLESPGTQPRLLGVLKAAVGGYWPEIWGGDGKLLVLFPARATGEGEAARFQVADITDPTDMRVVADRELPSGGDPQYAQFQDGFAFMDRYKIDMRNDFEVALTFDAEGNGMDMSQFSLPIGNLLASGGYPIAANRRQGLAIWAHQSEPDLEGPSVGYHIPRPDQTSYPVGAPISLLVHETLRSETIVNKSTFIVRPLDSHGAAGPPIDGRIVFTFDDILQFTPSSDLSPNTTYEVILPSGGIKDAVGNGMIPYSFRFSTGSGLSGGNRPPEISSFTVSEYPAGIAEAITFDYEAVDPDGEELSYKVQFGDGSGDSGWVSATSVVHSYAARGHYSAVLQARDASGATSSRRITVTVLAPPAGARPTNSSTIAFDRAGGATWAVNPDNDSVARVLPGGPALEVPLGDGANPRNVAVDGGGNAWVTCHGTDRVAVVAPSGEVSKWIGFDYGSAPYGIAISPDGETALVTLYGTGELMKLSVGSGAITGGVALGPTPRAIAISADGARALVTRFISPDRGGIVWDVSLTDMSVTREIELKLDNESSDSSSGGMGLPNYLAGIAITPDGLRAWVASKLDNIQRGSFVRGKDLSQENTVRAVVSEIDLVAGAEIYAARKDIDNADSPTSVTFSPFGDYAFVTLQGNNSVALYDTLRSAESERAIVPVIARFATGRAPQGSVFDTGRDRLIVQDFLSRQVTELAVGPLLSGRSSDAPASAISTIGSEKLHPTVLAGKRIFYNASDTDGPFGRNRMSGEGYISCASCHVDGGQDGRTWDFTGRGEGLRNTTDLRGRRGMGHGFVHWSANFDEIQDFEGDIRNFFGGAGFMQDGDFASRFEPLGLAKAGLSTDLDALAVYVSSLDKRSLPRSPLREADGGMTEAAIRGREIFVSSGCSACHGGPSFTESGLDALRLRDVGTLSTSSGLRLGLEIAGIDTPTLLSVFSSPPYLHDGSASTIEEVFALSGAAVLQAEDATLIGAEAIESIYVTYRGPWHAGKIVRFDGTSDAVHWTNVDGGAGGPGTIELRFASLYGDHRGTILVNGQAFPVTLADTGSSPAFVPSTFSTVAIEAELRAGIDNTIVFRPDEEPEKVFVDDMRVSNSSKRAASSAHRIVLASSPEERSDLVSFLGQLDGSDDEGPLFSPPEPGNGEPVDQCPSDPDKSSPGLCGCGVSDSDLDSDGTVDCEEAMAKAKVRAKKKRRISFRMSEGPTSYELELTRRKPRKRIVKRVTRNPIVLKLPAGRWKLRYRGCFGDVCSELSAASGFRVR